MNRDVDRLDPDFDPRVADWLEGDPQIAPPLVLDTIVAALPSVTQRRGSAPSPSGWFRSRTSSGGPSVSTDPDCSAMTRSEMARTRSM